MITDEKQRLGYPVIVFAVVVILHGLYFIWKKQSGEWLQVEDISPLASYFRGQDYLMGLSYALAASFTVYALLRFIGNRSVGLTGALGGLGLTGILSFAGCFLLGCCGSPMLAVYLNIFGSSFIGLTKPLTLTMTAVSVVAGYLWMERKKPGNKNPITLSFVKESRSGNDKS